MYPALSSATIVLSASANVFAILLPFVAAIVIHRRLRVGWRYFGYGLLTFLIFQVLTRLPLISVLQPLVAPKLQASPALLWGWLFILAFTAGLFEEVGRYVAFRFLMRGEEKTWTKAIMLGVGHGTIESAVLVGVGGLVLLSQLVSLAHGGLQTLPEAQRAVLAQQLAISAGFPAWVSLLSAWERACSLLIQVALSVVVLQVFRRRRLAWLGLAIAAHTVVDAVAVLLPQLLGSGTLRASVVTEAVLGMFALIAVWAIVTLRDDPAPRPSPTAGESPLSEVRPVGA